jgi:hypothetical protein
MKQTAVEYLVEQLSMDQYPQDIVKIIAKAKEIEKEQIMEAFIEGTKQMDDSGDYIQDIEKIPLKQPK